LKLALYTDGITAGNPMASDNKRKAYVWYLSFLEFLDKLQQTEVWIPVALERTPHIYPCIYIIKVSLLFLIRMHVTLTDTSHPCPDVLLYLYF